MANYTKEKSKYGGMVGTIQIFASQLPQQNSPSNTTFKSLLPAGFLRCDGSILSASEYPDLAEVIGVGKACRYVKDNITLADDEIQLPDLGSKYIVAGSGAGIYNDMFLQDEKTYHVGAEFNIASNVNQTETITYNGRFIVKGPQNPVLLGGSPLYKSSKSTDSTTLSEINFQAHGHGGNQAVFNYTGNYYVTTGTGPSSPGRSHSGDNCRCIAGNSFELTQPFGTADSTHSHGITMPTPGSHTHNFSWSFNTFNVGPDNLSTTVNIATTVTNTTFDDTQSPFILVEYIIKY
jgi:Phage Tail Collar Domain